MPHASQAQSATNVDITVTGTVQSGTDSSGMFGVPGVPASLTGDDFTLIATFDETKGTTGYAPDSSYIENSGGSNPGTAALTITNSTTGLEGTFIFGRNPSPQSRAYLVYDGNPADSGYSLLTGDGSYPGGSGEQGTVIPATGTELTTNPDWRNAFTNSALYTGTGTPLTIRINENPSQSASGDLLPTSITVSGLYVPGLPIPSAASNQTAKNTGTTCPCNTNTNYSDGHPINTATGNMYEVETDFTADPHLHLGLTRVYNSFSGVAGRFGIGWTDTWSRAVSGPVSGVVSVTGADGRVDTFTQSGSSYIPDADVTSVLTAVYSGMTQIGWQLVRDDDSTEAYNMSGQLTSITTRAGLVTSLTYTSGNLTTVTGPFARR
jgi:YD repeat-containing protein